jgi:ribose 1,5-bisphosphate isomerase
MTLQGVADDIKSMKVQGATNVALAALKAIRDHINQTKITTIEGFSDELRKAIRIFLDTRPTEPMMRNCMRYIVDRTKREGSIDDAKRIVGNITDEFLDITNKAKERISFIGSRRIREGMTIMTHGNSSTVIQLLKEASKTRKFKVFCTETRLLHEGRKTAAGLLKAGIDTTMILDCAARHFMKKIDMVIIGADAMTAEGNVISGVGASSMALVAEESRVRFYVASPLYKFDTETSFGALEKIEEGKPSDVWNNAPKGLKLRNPVFDVIPRTYIDGIITEEGIFAPETIGEIVKEKYPWMYQSVFSF